MKQMRLTGPGGKWLVFSNGVLGHTLYVLPALKALKDRYPQAYINMVVDSASAELVAASPLVDEVTVFNRKKDSLVRQWQIVKGWRKEKYDVSIHFRSGVRNEQLAFLASVKNRFGHKLKGSLQFVNNICFDVNDVHVLKKRSCMISQVLGEDVDLKAPEIHHDDIGADQVEKLLKDTGLSKGKYLVLHPAGKTFGGMNWSLERWACVAADVAKLIPVVVVCAPFERDAVSKAINGKNIFHFSGTVGFLSELIRRSGYFLGNDSAPAHIADAWRRPRVVVYPDAEKECIKWAPLHTKNCRVVPKKKFLDNCFDEHLDWLLTQN